MVDVHALIDVVFSGASNLHDVEEVLKSIPAQWLNARPNSLTPLMRAVQGGHAPLVAMLLDAQADLNITDSKGVTPLHMATFGGNREILQSLIEERADVNVRDRHGQTPFFFAPTSAVCQQLAVARANVHALNSKGQTPLHLAGFSGLNEVVFWLMANMKQEIIDQQDKHGRTAAYCAQSRRHLSTVTLLHTHGADLTKTPTSGTCSHLSSSRSRPTSSPGYRIKPLSMESGAVDFVSCAAFCADSLQKKGAEDFGRQDEILAQKRFASDMRRIASDMKRPLSAASVRQRDEKESIFVKQTSVFLESRQQRPGSAIALRR